MTTTTKIPKSDSKDTSQAHDLSIDGFQRITTPEYIEIEPPFFIDEPKLRIDTRK